MHQPGFIVVETNYRLYAYTGETAEGTWASRLRVGVGKGKEAGGNASFCLVYWILYSFLTFLITLEGRDPASLGMGSAPSFPLPVPGYGISPLIHSPCSSLLPVPGSESELQIALIALFSEMLYRFPNMVVAQVTRESVQQAIASGITAQQVSSLGEEGGRKTGCTWAVGYRVVSLQKASPRSFTIGGGELSVLEHRRGTGGVGTGSFLREEHGGRRYSSGFVSWHHHFLAA